MTDKRPFGYTAGMGSNDDRYKVGPLRAEEPPPKAMRISASKEILALLPQMQQQPKRWFRVAEFVDLKKASNVRNNLKRVAPQCEWTSRQVAGGSAIWGRWIGKPQ